MCTVGEMHEMTQIPDTGTRTHCGVITHRAQQSSGNEWSRRHSHTTSLPYSNANKHAQHKFNSIQHKASEAQMLFGGLRIVAHW